MIEKIKALIKQILTEPNNQTYCPVRITGTLGLVQYLVMNGHNYIAHHILDPQAFAVGFAAIITAVGAALAIKKDSPKE